MAVRREGGIGELTIQRPESLNALNRDTLLALRDAVGELDADAAIRAILLTGSGDRAFIAGADIKGMAAMSPEEVEAFIRLGQQVTLLIEQTSKPTVAAVNGYALGGGCEMALACDLIVAAESAQFGLPELDLGIIPGWGGTQRLARRVGAGRARDMIFTGRRVKADEALAIGLADRLFPGAQLMDEAHALCRSLADKTPLALRLAKRALAESWNLPPGDGLELERSLFVGAFVGPGRKAAMRRFLERK